MAAKEERERAFVENGSKLLEKLIVTCNGKSTPIRNFSYEELKSATNNFDDFLVIKEDLSKWYKGSLEGRNVLIKMRRKYSNFRPDSVNNDIAFSAMMNAHNNALRLIGCCLETQVPYIVFEFPANITLDDRILINHLSNGTQRRHEPMAWSSRLKIAREIAHAISYLHTAFSTPIIHRDVKSNSVFLDQDDVAKLSNFGLSVSIPKGENHVQDSGILTVGYICPDYAITGRVTEKVDVYLFGMLLFELLTGHKYGFEFETTRRHKDEDIDLKGYIREKCAQGCINEIVDPSMLQVEGRACIEHQIQAVLELFFTCIENDSEMRPTMVDVTKELRRIERSVVPP